MSLPYPSSKWFITCPFCVWGMRVVAVTLVVFEGLRGRLKMHFKLSSECFRGLRQGEGCVEKIVWAWDVYWLWVLSTSTAHWQSTDSFLKDPGASLGVGKTHKHSFKALLLYWCKTHKMAVSFKLSHPDFPLLLNSTASKPVSSVSSLPSCTTASWSFFQ